MASFEDLYVGNHRRQKSLVLIASLLCLLLAIAPRQQRALFITKGEIKAFGATFPPIVPARLLFPPNAFGGDGTPAAFFARTPTAARLVPAGAVPPAPEPPAAPGVPAAIQPSAPFGNIDSFLPDAPVPPQGGGLPLTPTDYTPPGTTPAAPVPGSTATTTPTPTPTPVSPVPEPATWLMMIAGFFMIGSTLRRQQSAVKRSARI